MKRLLPLTMRNTGAGLLILERENLRASDILADATMFFEILILSGLPDNRHMKNEPVHPAHNRDIITGEVPIRDCRKLQNPDRKPQYPLQPFSLSDPVGTDEQTKFHHDPGQPADFCD